jgi:hypothetical protein
MSCHSYAKASSENFTAPPRRPTLAPPAGSPGFDPSADVNADGVIDSKDLAAFKGQIAPPAIGAASATPNTLWPVDHKFVPVTLSYSTSDACGAPVVCTLSVTSNEPTGSKGPDWQIIDDHNLLLRAERLGKGTDRIYTVTITCSDPAGNSSLSSVPVTVPHDQGN